MNTLERRTNSDRRYFGVAEALVVDNVDPDEEGKVRVRFPWFDEESVSAWCRVCQFYAGPHQSGAVFVPEVDSEVLIAFIHGDMRQPIIVGSLYNGIDKPATPRNASRDEKLIRTRSGHQITLVDTQGEERIVIVDKSGAHSIEFNTADSRLAIQSRGGTLSLTSREIEIEAEETLTFRAKRIEQSASEAFEATASGEMTLKGSTINLN